MMIYATLIAGTCLGFLVACILRSGSIADELALIDEIDRLKMELVWHTHAQQQRQGSIVSHAARIASVARGDA